MIARLGSKLTQGFRSCDAGWFSGLYNCMLQTFHAKTLAKGCATISNRIALSLIPTKHSVHGPDNVPHPLVRMRTRLQSTNNRSTASTTIHRKENTTRHGYREKAPMPTIFASKIKTIRAGNWCPHGPPPLKDQLRSLGYFAAAARSSRALRTLFITAASFSTSFAKYSKRLGATMQSLYSLWAPPKIVAS